MKARTRIWFGAATVVAVSVLALPVGQHAPTPQPAQSAVQADQLQLMPLSFTQNNGQWPDSVLYRANAGGATMWFTPNGAYYQFTRRIPKADGASTEPNAMVDPVQMPGRDQEHDSVETMMIKASFVGCNPKPELAGDNLLEYRCNWSSPDSVDTS